MQHFEDIPLDEFLLFLRKLKKKQLNCILTEKVDGAAISFGVDEKGFYTSRESKGGIRYYSEFEYPKDQFWATPFRSAHKALASLDLQVGVYVNAEILFGSQPNTVQYSNTKNQIVLLTTKGINLDEIDALETKVVLYNIPDTVNGRKITTIKSKTHHWQINKVPQIEKSKLEAIVSNPIFNESIDMLYWILRQPNKRIPTLTNKKILDMKLNKRPDDFPEWKEIKEVIKMEREDVAERIMAVKLSIKELFLMELVYNTNSGFGGDWIEGVVLQYDEEFIKFVDRDIFWEANSANYEERNKVAGRGDNLKNRVRDSMISAANLPKINKRYIGLMGSTYSERLTNISAHIIFGKTKKMWTKIIKDGLVELERMRAAYYDPTTCNQPIDKRTLMIYAQTFSHLENLKISIAKTTNSKGLIESWLVDKLNL